MTTSERVESILKHSKEARNSDKQLWIIYAQKSGVGLSQSQIEKIVDMPSFETLRRVRQKIQEQGKYEADKEIKLERKHKAMIMQQVSPKANPEQLENYIKYRPLPWGQ